MFAMSNVAPGISRMTTKNLEFLFQFHVIEAMLELPSFLKSDISRATDVFFLPGNKIVNV
jgi:hypothetical protein